MGCKVLKGKLPLISLLVCKHSGKYWGFHRKKKNSLVTCSGGKSLLMLAHKFMNHAHLSVKFRHQELILALMIHHLHTLWHPFYGWYGSWNGWKQETLAWQDVLKLRETLCIHFQKHQSIKTLIVGKKFRRKNSFKQNHWHDNFFPCSWWGETSSWGWTKRWHDGHVITVVPWQSLFCLVPGKN